MRMYIGGEWIDAGERMDVTSPFDGSVVDVVPRAGAAEVERALASASRGAPVMAALPAHERYRILDQAARLMEARLEELARTITLEEGKAIAEARVEVQRSFQTLTLSAEEAKRLYGETLPLDAAPGGAGKIGFTLRVPCGVVVAISPFNFPLNLVCHKVGPALAAGNAVVIKPASDTPLSALKLVEILLEAGLPPEGVQCITGPGGELGRALCADPRVRKITFTGSRDVGEAICRIAGLKRVTMELGSNCPLIVMSDADLEKAAAATAATGYVNAGQVCISTQRVLVQDHVYGDFLDALTPLVGAIPTGDPLDEGVKMGPMIRTADAERVAAWIGQAVAGGARVAVGGERSGNLHQPTVVADVAPGMRVSCDELFGPAVAVTRFDDLSGAIALANDTRYGLAAGIFTENLRWAMDFARRVHSGNLHVNWGPGWRADLMPYGGLKESGMGKEGPRYAIHEMTELKTVVLHLG
ncbi:MAG TPA: aldehyde dehydrogenase family protein [Longimicrobiales bacterium]|nr:aldehyde dehydrogenase family protein [Longimicrobiales bacterium]